MAGPATILREIHRLKKFAKELQSEIERAPRLLKAQQGKIAGNENSLKEAQDAIKKLKMANHDKESLLKGTEVTIAKHEKQRNEATSKKEYDALQAEITSERKKIRDYEDLILEGMGQIEEATAKLPELEKSIKAAKEQYSTLEKNSQARAGELGQQLEKTLAELKQVEATLPEDIREKIVRVLAARGEDALATVENRTCMACYTEITAQNYNELVQSQLVMCKSCGRALYLPE